MIELLIYHLDFSDHKTPVELCGLQQQNIIAFDTHKNTHLCTHYFFNNSPLKPIQISVHSPSRPQPYMPMLSNKLAKIGHALAGENLPRIAKLDFSKCQQKCLI